MLKTSIEWINQNDLVGLNVDVAFTNLQVTVGSNVHLIAGKRILINKKEDWEVKNDFET